VTTPTRGGYNHSFTTFFSGSFVDCSNGLSKVPRYGEAADFTAVSEPGTLSLFDLGPAGIGLVSRRKKLNAMSH
jgi:hypothetical protein